MRPFFDQENLNIRVLSLLEQQPNWTFTDLAATLCVDRATLAKNVKQLISIIDSQHLTSLQLIQTNQGLHYHRSAGFNLASLMPMLVDQRPGIIFESLFNEFQHSLSGLANKLFVSESTTRRLIRHVNHVLAAYRIKINTRQMTLEGAEANIRYAAFQYYWNTYGSVTWPFFVNEQEYLRASKQAGLPANDQLRYAFWVAICRMRQLKGHHLTAADLRFSSTTPEEHFLRLVYLVDFENPQQLAGTSNTVFPDWQSPALCRLLNQKALPAILQAAHYYSAVFGAVPLLYDRAEQLQQIRQTADRAGFVAIEAACSKDPLLILKTCELLRMQHSSPLRQSLRLALVTDSDPVERSRTMKLISQVFSDYDFTWVPDYHQAQLIITNLTLPDAGAPIVYVNVPIALHDLELVQDRLAKI